MVDLAVVAFATGCIAGATNLAGFAWSVRVPERRYWPPGERDWRYYAQWTVAQTVTVSMAATAFLDWNSLGLPRPLSLYAGLALFVPGFAGALAAGRNLGSAETSGLLGDLQTDSWYRFSRNPQYVCYAVATVGFALVANSTLAAGLSVVQFAIWLALPFPEEPWLSEQYGDAYDEYRERVPRFVGVHTLRELVGLVARDRDAGDATTPDR
ncbi:isoprenylcysteine carboxylmethyltransferase family protein [Halorubellus sp. PRR65]|uniref:methyltransferase family protein n=1 Tax=Halorubellus sp. PRR65 TaxID=3098148 RepID=UPI002B25A72C|nr:isoprenylcysteine carboxylmethyltransferase family protein [Halorubellus sp. PRR65]